MNTKNVAVFGSAFNPPHFGHKDILNQINLEFDEIVLIPSYRHAFGKVMAPYEFRLAMASYMAEIFEDEKKRWGKPLTPLLVSDIERSLGEQNDQPVYTYDVLNEVERQYKINNIDVKLTFVLGPDNANIQTWKQFHRAEEIKQRWQLRPVSERLKVHSTQIRKLIGAFPRPEELFVSRLSHFMEPLVADYIYKNNLYGAKA